MASEQELQALEAQVLVTKHGLDRAADDLARVKADHKLAREEYDAAVGMWGRAKWGAQWADPDAV